LQASLVVLQACHLELAVAHLELAVAHLEHLELALEPELVPELLTNKPASKVQLEDTQTG
jgi:hypothetical protein